MKKWKEYYLSDLSRYEGNIDKKTKLFIKLFRKCQFSSGISLFIHRYFFMKAKQKMNIEMYGKTNIGPGLYIGHPYGITINSNVVIGSNCNIHKGVTIGQENRGLRKGVPTIGNHVWVGVNSTIVGRVTIGDDVLIAPNTFVNCDIPSHSVVIGNPCIIKHKENATESYINHPCEE